jgi:lipopolysaccharide export system protein LptA
MTMSFAPRRVVAAAFIAAASVGVAPLHSQPAASGPPNALQGFSQNRDKPIKINSASLEVRDRDKMATFSGDVHLVQGDTTMHSKTLVVFYDDDPASKPAKPPAASATAAAPVNQQIRRVEARGDVIVKQKDQTATGENGVFDMRANTVTLLGNVVISQGQNVVKGDRLTVDMTSGVSRVECGKTQGTCRVQALIQPGGMKPETRPQEPAHNAAPGRDPPRQRSPQPSGLY